MKEKKEQPASQYVEKRLINRLRIYLLIISIMLGIVICEVLIGTFSISWAIGGILIGFGVGILVSRMYRLSWDEKNSHVIGHIDKIGAVILVCYMIFIFTRTNYLSHWVQGASLTTMILSLTAGTMLGNMMSTQRGIKKILKTLNIQL